MELIKRGVCGCWYFFWGHIFGWLFYDKKYLRGRWFDGKLHGLCSTGWRWVVYDAVARMLLRQNIDARFPVGHQMRVVCPQNVEFDPNDLNNFQAMGIYLQAIGKITIGSGTYLGPNVGIITSNHNLYNLDEHTPPKPVVLGKHCWIGMNSTILPGCVLGGGGQLSAQTRWLRNLFLRATA